MKRVVAMLLLPILLGTIPALGQDAQELLQQALVKERVEGSLDEAITLYERIAQDDNADRSVVAQALLRMAACHEKLGRAQAQGIYEQIVAEYADQTDVAAEARSRLTKLAVVSSGGSETRSIEEPVYTQVLDIDMSGGGQWDQMMGKQYSFSPDGERLAFFARLPADDQPRVYLADRTGAVVRRLLSAAAIQPGWQLVGYPRWSPGGDLIAIETWRRVAESEPDPERPEPKIATLLIRPDGTDLRPLDWLDIRPDDRRDWTWLPDGSGYRLRGTDSQGRMGFHSVDLGGNKLDYEPSSNGLQQLPSGRSKDGRWYLVPERESDGIRGDTDISLAPALGEGPRLRLAGAPDALEVYPFWSRDGGAVYYVSHTGSPRTGRGNLWKIAVDPDTGQPRGEPEQVTHYRDTVVQHPELTADGDRIAFVLARSNPTLRIGQVGVPDSATTLARSRWGVPSPDGKTVYYQRDEAGIKSFWSIPSKGGTPRPVTPRSTGDRATTEGLTVSPDGTSLAYIEGDGGSAQLYVIPSDGGEPTLLAEIDRPAARIRAAWAPDGTRIAFASEQTLYTIPMTGGPAEEIARLQGGWDCRSIRWSPDGEHIAALGAVDEGVPAQVLVVPASGGEVRQLTFDNQIEYLYGLEWHPDSRRLTYMYSDINNHSGTRMAYVDGRSPTLLVDQPDAWDWIGRWSPNGRDYYFLVASNQGASGSNWSLYVHDIETGETRLVAEPDSGSVTLPSFNRDGTVMVWSVADETRQVWTIENYR